MVEPPEHDDGQRAGPATARLTHGVGVLLFRDGKLLLGRRLSPHGRGSWSPPGGKTEPGETDEECARRELLEETGLAGAVPRVVAETVDAFPGGETYHTRFVRMDWVEGEPQVLEPDACESWEWYVWDRLPSPLFLPMASLVASGYDPHG